MQSILYMDQITLDFATELRQIYIDHQIKFDDDEDEMELALPKLKGGSNWIGYRDTFVLKSQSYLIDDTPRQVRHANAAYIEVDVLDLSNEEIFITTTVHFGNAYNTDNKKLW